MSAVLSRRSLAKAGAAVLGMSAAGIPAATRAVAVEPDAVLVTLMAQHAKAMADLAALDAAADPMRQQFRAKAPSRPKALLWRSSDFVGSSYGLGASNAAGGAARAYGARGVEWLRQAKPSGHWPAASEVRRREIVEAHDRWQAARIAYADRIGLTAANDACDRQSELVSDLEAAICGFTPTTLSGFRAKARWIASSPQADEWAAFLMRDLSGVTS